MNDNFNQPLQVGDIVAIMWSGNAIMPVIVKSIRTKSIQVCWPHFKREFEGRNWRGKMVDVGWIAKSKRLYPSSALVKIAPELAANFQYGPTDYVHELFKLRQGVLLNTLDK